MEERVSLKDIYVEFLLLGIQLLGGGYVIIPLIKKFIIEKHKWITESELTDFYALSQSIPGLVAANVSTFIGYKLRKKTGAMAALLGIVTSPIISILLIASIIDILLNFSYIQSIFWGVQIAVIILIYLSIKEMWPHSVNDIMSWVIFIIAFVSSYIFKISPVNVIFICVFLGLLFKILQKRCYR